MMIEDIIKKTLYIPVLEEPSSLHPACATYMEYYTGPGLAGDGSGQEWVASCEVDLWYKKRSALDEAVVKLLSVIGLAKCSIPSVEKSCDPSTRIWRAIIKFEKMEGNADEW